MTECRDGGAGGGSQVNDPTADEMRTFLEPLQDGIEPDADGALGLRLQEADLVGVLLPISAYL